MIRQGNTPGRRRAVALLLTVAAIAVIAVGAAALAATAAAARAAASLERSELIASELLRASEAPIRSWLMRRAPGAVLPPDAAEPRIALFSERWEIDGVEVRLRICAFDQLGMVPWSHAAGGSMLRMPLPEDVVAAAKARGGGGLDEVGPLARRRAFPAPADAGPAATAFGALVATHASAPARINVNTAPAALLEQAFRTAGRGGAGAVLASRAQGRPASLPARSPAERRDAAADAWRVELVGASDTWSFRIDVVVGALRRSWWEVHRSGTSEGWECVQRLAIVD